MDNNTSGLPTSTDTGKQYKHLLNEMDLSLIYQMGENIRGIRDHSEHPHEVLSVVLVYLIGVMYQGMRHTVNYDPTQDIQKLIDNYQNGGIPTFKDLLVKIGEEVSRLGKEKQDAKAVQEREG